jgi:voltage-gated potassium channel
MENKYSNIVRFAKVKYAVMVMMAITVMGTIGFMIVENLSFIDAIYLSIVTISTVGYSDLQITTIGGKLFAIVLIITSWAAFAYSVSVITSHFVEGGIGNFIYRYRHKNILKKMKNHTIIIGYGRNGSQAATVLLKQKSNFIVIERNHELIMNNLGSKIQFTEGDATEDNILEEAEIRKAKAIIITLPIDADNLFITISARALNPNIQIITRATNDSAEKKLLIAGADEVVMPGYVGGSHMAAMVNSVDVVHFLEQISLSGSADTNLVEIICSDLPESLINQSIYELGIRTNSGANIVGFKTPDGQFVTNPTPDTKIIPQSKLFVLGNPKQISKMKNILHIK